MPLRVLLDTVAYNRAVEDEALGSLLRRAYSDGHIAIVTSHVQVDQLKKASDPIKREKMLSLLSDITTEEVATAAFVWDVSRWDHVEWPSDAALRFFELALIGTKPGQLKHANDGLLAVTAYQKADVFVTDDNKLLRRTRNAVMKTGATLAALSVKEFTAHLEIAVADKNGPAHQGG
jgi:predicted nucleic acid-binding protein